MQGHIRKRTHKTKDGRITVNWYVVIELARDSTGKRRQKWYGSYRTRKEAEAARIDILHQINTGTWVEPTSTTFGEWVHETWLPLVAQRLKPSAEAHYRNYLRLHILPTLGPLQFRQITPTILNQLYTRLLTDGNRKTGGPLSTKTVTNVRAIIHKALKDAVDLGLVNVNMADRAKPPRPKAKKPKAGGPSRRSASCAGRKARPSTSPSGAPVTRSRLSCRSRATKCACRRCTPRS